MDDQNDDDEGSDDEDDVRTKLIKKKEIAILKNAYSTHDAGDENGSGNRADTLDG